MSGEGARLSDETVDTPQTCPDCRHQAHGEWCPNLASDNDCACTTVVACVDAACRATSPEGCKYPMWMVCGFPGRRPARQVSPPGEARS